MWVLRWSLFWYALLKVLSSFAIILTRKRKLIASHLLSFGGLITVNILWPFFTVPCVGLQCAIVVFLIILIYFFTYYLYVLCSTLNVGDENLSQNSGFLINFILQYYCSLRECMSF